MNQPDRYVQFLLPEGERKVTYKADTKLKDAGTFSFRSEDHTMGNLLRMQLHSDKATVFAGYRIPHPLEPVMVVKVQTNGTKAPEDAMSHALQDLASEFDHMRSEFERATSDVQR
ncbi:DNA-directed RNA polymerase II subunit RPB11 [Tetrabaena socialis]|uniref:DNA-directed RNA polymerase II subunit RPB11 n=1 Tax=Tetrabaena socialis TaxID=47790 RepID=A0A2J7ZZB5_9CHLO|nr:DNA-directed RNA polymerase II subunit RPB11 [Tetrabaena socialis]|eukprot:PNH05605.1 DNA-directed RNA polymerase II subunit RPB11 [Tetrabaena socialis]